MALHPKDRLCGETNARDEFGLKRNFPYVFKEDGSVDWVKLLKPEHFFPNKYNFEKRGEKVPANIADVADADKLLSLSGLKYLAELRGYESLEYSTPKLDNGYVVVKCSISWIPNFENERGLRTEEVANATAHNTELLVRPYLETVAANRAFSRAVRNALLLNFVSEAEVGEISEEDTESGTVRTVEPADVLRAFALEKGLKTFDAFKAAVAEKCEEPELKEKTAACMDWKDLDPTSCRKLKAFLKNRV